MELTGAMLIVVLAIVAVVLFVVLVIGLPRHGRRWWRLGARAGQLIVLNLAVVALFGALLNDQYYFYSSWSDLLGSRSPSVSSHAGGIQADVLRTKVAGPGLTGVGATAPLPRLQNPSARLQDYQVRDPHTGQPGQVLVYLPVGYNPSSPRAYPVLVGLHGFPASPQSFARLNFFSTADQLTAEHRLAPSIIVVPRINTPTTLDTECVNGAPGEPQTDTWLSRDLPNWVVHHFRVQTARTSWATIGYSYGAWCAASLAMRHPGVFGAAIVLLGYFRPDFTPYYDPLSPAATRGYDLVRLAHSAPPPVAMWVLTARTDPLSYPTTSRFLAAARPPLYVTSVVLASGGHRTSLFTPYVPSAMAWLGQTLPGFHA